MLDYIGLYHSPSRPGILLPPVPCHKYVKVTLYQIVSFGSCRKSYTKTWRYKYTNNSFHTVFKETALSHYLYVANIMRYYLSLGQKVFLIFYIVFPIYFLILLLQFRLSNSVLKHQSLMWTTATTSFVAVWPLPYLPSQEVLLFISEFLHPTNPEPD